MFGKTLLNDHSSNTNNKRVIFVWPKSFQTRAIWIVLKRSCKLEIKKNHSSNTSTIVYKLTTSHLTCSDYNLNTISIQILKTQTHKRLQASEWYSFYPPNNCFWHSTVFEHRNKPRINARSKSYWFGSEDARVRNHNF